MNQVSIFPPVLLSHIAKFSRNPFVFQRRLYVLQRKICSAPCDDYDANKKSSSSLKDGNKRTNIASFWKKMKEVFGTEKWIKKISLRRSALKTIANEYYKVIREAQLYKDKYARAVAVIEEFRHRRQSELNEAGTVAVKQFISELLEKSDQEEKQASTTTEQENCSSNVELGDTENGIAGEPEYPINIATRIITLNGRICYVNLKEKDLRRYVHISKTEPDGQKCHLNFPVNCAAELCDHLESLIRVFDQTASRNARPQMSLDKPIRAVISSSPRSCYFLDLISINESCYLRIVQCVVLSSGHENEIIIPAEGMVQLKKVVSDLLQKYPKKANNEGETSTRILEPKGISVRNKGYYFLVEQSTAAARVRIFEMRPGKYQTITIPQEAWIKTSELLRELNRQFENGLAIPGSEGINKKQAHTAV